MKRHTIALYLIVFITGCAALWAKGAPEAPTGLTYDNRVQNGGKNWIGPIHGNTITFRWTPPVEDADSHPANEYSCIFKKTSVWTAAAYGWPFTQFTTPYKTVSFDQADLAQNDYIFILTPYYSEPLLLHSHEGKSVEMSPIRYDGTPPTINIQTPVNITLNGGLIKGQFFHGNVKLSFNCSDSQSGLTTNSYIKQADFYALKFITNGNTAGINQAYIFSKPATNGFIYIDTVNDYASNDGITELKLNVADNVENSITHTITLNVDNSPPIKCDPSKLKVFFMPVASTNANTGKQESLINAIKANWETSQGDIAGHVLPLMTNQVVTYYTSFPEATGALGNDSPFDTPIRITSGIIGEKTVKTISYSTGGNGDSVRGRYYKLAVVAEDELTNRQTWPGTPTDPHPGTLYPDTIYVPKGPARIEKVIAETISDATELKHKVTVILDKKRAFLFEGENESSNRFAISGLRIIGKTPAETVIVDDPASIINTTCLVNDLDKTGWKLLDPADYSRIDADNGVLAYSFTLDDMPHGMPDFKVETMHLSRFGENGTTPVEYVAGSYYRFNENPLAENRENRLPNYEARFKVFIEELDSNAEPVQGTRRIVDPFSSDFGTGNFEFSTSAEYLRMGICEESDLENDRIRFQINELSTEATGFTPDFTFGKADVIREFDAADVFGGVCSFSFKYQELFEKLTASGTELQDALEGEYAETSRFSFRIKFDWLLTGCPVTQPVIDDIQTPGYILELHRVNGVNVRVLSDRTFIDRCLLAVIEESAAGSVTSLADRQDLVAKTLTVNTGADLRNIPIDVPGITFEEGVPYVVASQVRNCNGIWSAVCFSEPLYADFSLPVLTADNEDMIINDYHEIGSGIVATDSALTVFYSLNDNGEKTGIDFYIRRSDGSEETVAGSHREIEKAAYGGMFGLVVPANTVMGYASNGLYARMGELDADGNILRSTDYFVRSLSVNRAPRVSLEYTALNPGESLDFMDYLTIVDDDYAYSPARRENADKFAIMWNYSYDSVHPENSGVWTSGSVKTFDTFNFQGREIAVRVADRFGKESAVSPALVFVMPTKRGFLQGNETWGIYSSAGTTVDHYAIIGDIHTLDHTLSVTDGVTVVVMGDYGIFVQGGGKFSANEHSTLRYRRDLVVSRRMYWKGIRVLDRGRINLDDAVVSDAIRAVAIEESPPTDPGREAAITRVLFENNQIGVHVLGRTQRIFGCTFRHNRYYALKEDRGAEFEPVNCTFDGNGLDKSADGSGVYYDYYDSDTRSVLRARDLNVTE